MVINYKKSENPQSLYGEKHEGQYHLGPVDFEETEYNNACSPYADKIIDLESKPSTYLMGVSGTYAGDGSLCDACAFIETAEGKSLIARLITYGATNSEGDIDVSPQAYDALNQGEYPRTMTWQLSSCDSGLTGSIYYQFQTEANIWWTSLWVRNAFLPVEKVEVISSKHTDWFELVRKSDGTLNDSGGFGEGAFTLRVTAMNGDQIEDTFEQFSAGDLLVSPSGNFNCNGTDCSGSSSNKTSGARLTTCTAFTIFMVLYSLLQF
ncbi:hypothetical protein M0812_21798 [Anaeramoeba flamelloides]|uniref:Uncharacterized protein n=1 Tax=Anaeramoeba flamelloides TaxID=1746091 RepID=A0AAV7YWR7_9EUKA|nr:hypothetical protein M0812_21798 [Anaeramoeba flamelloides]